MKSNVGSTFEDLARRLSLSNDIIRLWIKKRTIQYHKIERQYKKLRLSEVDEWVDSEQSANTDQ
jgi:excisionase family DNA binding protein